MSEVIAESRVLHARQLQKSNRFVEAAEIYGSLVAEVTQWTSVSASALYNQG